MPWFIFSCLQWDVFLAQILSSWMTWGLDFTRTSEFETGWAEAGRCTEAVGREIAHWQDVARCLSFKPPKVQICQGWQGLAHCISPLMPLPNLLNPDMGNTCCLSTGLPWRSTVENFLSQVRPPRHGLSGAWSVCLLDSFPSPVTRVQSHKQKNPAALWFSCDPVVQEKGCLSTVELLCWRSDEV